jgi:antitoxin (DNA-binding transcriptional repressor) of toxin-antitoxin stability system
MSLVKTIKVSEAKRNFSRIFARAKRGETVILQNGEDYMQLVPCAVPDAVPVRPVGYFQSTGEEIAAINAAPTDAAPVR